MTRSLEHLRGQLTALRSVRRWLQKCWERNCDFQFKFANTAPKWQFLASKYGALTQEGHIKGLDSQIAKLNKRIRKMSHD